MLTRMRGMSTVNEEVIGEGREKRTRQKFLWLEGVCGKCARQKACVGGLLEKKREGGVCCEMRLENRQWLNYPGS